MSHSDQPSPGGIIPQVIKNDLWCHSRIFANPLKKRKFEKGTKDRLLRSLANLFRRFRFCSYRTPPLQMNRRRATRLRASAAGCRNEALRPSGALPMTRGERPGWDRLDEGFLTGA